MITLGIETTTKVNGLALLRDEEILDEEQFQSEDTSQEIFIRLAQFLKKNGISLNEVDLFVVSLGPGSWTGIRLGITLIKGFVVDSEKKAVGVHAPERQGAGFLARVGYRQFQEKGGSNLKDLKPFYGKNKYSEFLHHRAH